MVIRDLWSALIRAILREDKQIARATWRGGVELIDVHAFHGQRACLDTQSLSALRHDEIRLCGEIAMLE